MHKHLRYFTGNWPMLMFGRPIFWKQNWTEEQKYKKDKIHVKLDPEYFQSRSFLTVSYIYYRFNGAFIPLLSQHFYLIRLLKATHLIKLLDNSSWLQISSVWYNQKKFLLKIGNYGLIPIIFALIYYSLIISAEFEPSKNSIG